MYQDINFLLITDLVHVLTLTPSEYKARVTLNMRRGMREERLTGTHLTLMTPWKVETIGMIPAHIGLTLTTLVRSSDITGSPYLVYIMAASVMVLVSLGTVTLVSPLSVDTISQPTRIVTECRALKRFSDLR